MVASALLGIPAPVGADLEPPYFHPGYPAAGTITGSAFNLKIKLNEAGVAHYAVGRRCNQYMGGMGG